MPDRSETHRLTGRPANLASEVPDAWPRLLRAHAAMTRQMDADLIAAHQITLSDYAVLLQLVQAPERRLRRVDLAELAVLTQSGITRLLAGLEKAGFVERAACATDGRVVYAQLTDAGLEKLRASAVTHLESIRELFSSRFSAPELDDLAALLDRLPTTRGGGACTAG
jgi:DNA-binding MarR family transcriptional regulator